MGWDGTTSRLPNAPAGAPAALRQAGPAVRAGKPAVHATRCGEPCAPMITAVWHPSPKAEAEVRSPKAEVSGELALASALDPERQATADERSEHPTSRTTGTDRQG